MNKSTYVSRCHLAKVKKPKKDSGFTKYKCTTCEKDCDIIGVLKNDVFMSLKDFAKKENEKLENS